MKRFIIGPCIFEDFFYKERFTRIAVNGKNFWGVEIMFSTSGILER